LPALVHAAPAYRETAVAAAASAQGQLADLQQQSEAAAKTLADLQAKIQAQPAPDAAKPQ